MKKIALLILVFLSAAVFAENRMTITVNNLSISVPEGWLAEYTNSQQLFFLYAPLEQNDDFQENCNLTYENLPRIFSIKEYMDLSIEMLDDVFNNFQMIERKDNYHIISGDMNNIRVKQIQYVYMDGRTAYVLTFSSVPGKFDTYLETFKGIAQTFTIQ